MKIDQFGWRKSGVAGVVMKEAYGREGSVGARTYMSRVSHQRERGAGAEAAAVPVRWRSSSCCRRAGCRGNCPCTHARVTHYPMRDLQLLLRRPKVPSNQTLATVHGSWQFACQNKWDPASTCVYTVTCSLQPDGVSNVPENQLSQDQPLQHCRVKVFFARKLGVVQLQCIYKMTRKSCAACRCPWLVHRCRNISVCASGSK